MGLCQQSHFTTRKDEAQYMNIQYIKLNFRNWIFVQLGWVSDWLSNLQRQQNSVSCATGKLTATISQKDSGVLVWADTWLGLEHCGKMPASYSSTIYFKTWHPPKCWLCHYLRFLNNVYAVCQLISQLEDRSVRLVLTFLFELRKLNHDMTTIYLQINYLQCCQLETLSNLSVRKVCCLYYLFGVFEVHLPWWAATLDITPLRETFKQHII